jgi:hypothetical protein
MHWLDWFVGLAVLAGLYSVVLLQKRGAYTRRRPRR